MIDRWAFVWISSLHVCAVRCVLRVVRIAPAPMEEMRLERNTEPYGLKVTDDGTVRAYILVWVGVCARACARACVRVRECVVSVLCVLV